MDSAYSYPNNQSLKGVIVVAIYMKMTRVKKMEWFPPKMFKCKTISFKYLEGCVKRNEINHENGNVEAKSALVSPLAKNAVLKSQRH